MSLAEEPPQPPDVLESGERVLEVEPCEGVVIVPNRIGVLNLQNWSQRLSVETRPAEDGGTKIVIVLLGAGG